jgi:hypothetical protein
MEVNMDIHFSRRFQKWLISRAYRRLLYPQSELITNRFNSHRVYGDVVHGGNYPYRFRVIQSVIGLIINEIKYFFRKCPDVTLTDAIQSWNDFLKQERLNDFLSIGDFIHGRNYKSYPLTSVLFPITLR